MSQSTEQATPLASPGRKRKPALIVAAIALVLGVSGVVGYTMVGREQKDAASEHDPTRPEAAEPLVVALDPFILNLADQDDDRYLRATVHVVLEREPDAKEDLGYEGLEHTRLRDRILTILSSKAAEEVTTYEGKEALRAELHSEISALFPGRIVSDVLFAEFLVQ